MALLICFSILCAGMTVCFAEKTTDSIIDSAEEVVASDYSDESNWLKIPEITKKVDTFYIYPTAYFDTSAGAPDVCGIPEAADAQLNVTRGVVVTHTDVIAPMDEAMGFGPDSYHGGDYSLWYSNIESNVQLRVDRYLSEH